MAGLDCSVALPEMQSVEMGNRPLVNVMLTQIRPASGQYGI